MPAFDKVQMSPLLRTLSISGGQTGVDLLFWPRTTSTFPFLGAAQVKHHRNLNATERPATVREFSGTLAGHPFNAGLLVTNTSFSPDAKWFAREDAKLMKLRDCSDIRRWLLDDFTDEAEWREIPPSTELCPGVVARIRERCIRRLPRCSNGIERAKRKSTESLDAYDYFLRGMSKVYGGSREAIGEAPLIMRGGVPCHQGHQARPARHADRDPVLRYHSQERLRSTPW